MESDIFSSLPFNNYLLSYAIFSTVYDYFYPAFDAVLFTTWIVRLKLVQISILITSIFIATTLALAMDNVQTSGSSSLATCKNSQQTRATNKKVGWQWCPEDILWSIYEKLGLESIRWNSTAYYYISKKFDEKFCSKFGLAAYSTACKRWEEFFEPLLYQCLTLTQYCVYRFSRITRTHHLIEHISLRIEHYLTACAECHGSFSDSEYIVYDNATALHIERLLAILSTWQRNPSTDIQRLT